MNVLRGTLRVLLALTLSLSTVGCLRKVLLDGQIRGTRDGSAAVNTLHDFDVARAVARAGIGQLEGMHKLAPYNEDGLFLLTRAWGAATFAFTEDEWELAKIAGDKHGAEYHRQRALAGYERAKFYGLELLSKRAPGFERARTNAETMRDWLHRYFNDPKEADNLLWTGYAWVSEVNVGKDMPEIVAELYVGVEIVRRSIELDEKLENAMGHTILGAYHARTALSELDDSEKHFKRALELNEGKFLPTLLNYGTRYYCARSDRENYRKVLSQVLEAEDPLPEARLSNVVAKRRARRYLDNERIFTEDCGFLG